MKSKRATDAVALANGSEDHPNAEKIDSSAKKRKRSDPEETVDGGAKKVKKDKSEKKSKKDKKDKKESRKEKKDKRKDLQDLPEEDNEEAEEQQPATNGDAGGEDSAAVNGDKKDRKKKDKSEKKKDKKEKKKANKANGAPAPATTPNEADNEPDQTPIDLPASTNNGDSTSSAAAASGGKQDRHIVFVGNLPYTATAASISAHFASLSPVAVRCLRDKNDKDESHTCRGIAFVEFGKVWHMRTCLDKFHKSNFDDGLSAPRKINVELTAGGGGKTKQRQHKIREKNKKLEENRAKRIEKEKEVKANGGAGGAAAQQSNMEDNIHPSRRARVPGGY